MPKVALFSGPLDPPLRFHRDVVQQLLLSYDQVIVVPGGPRPGKAPASLPIHRATLVDLTFAKIANVEVDLTDLERAGFTPAYEHEAALKNAGFETVHVVPSEFIKGGANGASVIHAEWTQGPILWAQSQFVVLISPGDDFKQEDLPPFAKVIQVSAHESGETIRLRAAQGQTVAEFLVPLAAEYVHRWGLYKDVPSPRPAPYCLTEPRFRLFVDELNPVALKLAEQLKPFSTTENPNTIVTIGGDGTMLRAIRKHWRDRLPFFGINAGGQGFLLNGRELEAFWQTELRCYQLPLLWIETEYCDGSRSESLAFNDAWVERATGQTAWVKLTVNGVVRVPRLVGDGALVSTAAGSSSYARAMGASPFPLTADVLLLVGSNVLKPTFWRPAVLPPDSVVEMEAVDENRRPLRAFIDGVEQRSLVKRLTIRISRTASAELAFMPNHDPVAKLAFVQFPPQEL